MIASTSNRFSEMFHRFHFHALNTNVDIMIWAESQEIAVIERLAVEWFRDTELRFCRNYPHSELNHLNTLSGERCKVSDQMMEILALTETYRKATHNTYNPLVSSSSNSHLQLSLDSDSKSVRLPEETTLELQDIVQNWILLRLADMFQHRMKLKQGLLRVGESYKVWGRPVDSFDPWVIGINKPGQTKGLIATVSLSEGAIATYSTQDPEANYWNQCTVTGMDPVECGIWAQAIAKLGSEKGLSLIAQHAAYCEVLSIDEHSKLHYYGDKASLGSKWNEINVDYYH